MTKEDEEISQDEYERQVQWTEDFAREQRRRRRITEYANEFGYRLVRKPAGKEPA